MRAAANDPLPLQPGLLREPSGHLVKHRLLNPAIIGGQQQHRCDVLLGQGFGGADAIPAGKALLTIRTVPEGATIVVHDRVSSEKTNIRMLVDPGSYEIVLKLNGYKPVARTVALQGGQQRSIDEFLEKQP